MQDTSLEAYAESRDTAADLRILVLDYLRRCGTAGATDEEMDVLFGTEKSRSNRPARLELVRMGLVMDSGMRRPTRCNKTAIVWIVTPPHLQEENTEAQKQKNLAAALRKRVTVLPLPLLEKLSTFLTELEAEACSLPPVTSPTASVASPLEPVVQEPRKPFVPDERFTRDDLGDAMRALLDEE